MRKNWSTCCIQNVAKKKKSTQPIHCSESKINIVNQPTEQFSDETFFGGDRLHSDRMSNIYIVFGQLFLYKIRHLFVL